VSRAITARFYTVIALGLLSVLFSFTIYKAWTQSITLDEAYTYKTWVAAPFSSFYTVSGYNNHPLNTLLCRLAVGALGPSELALRLPSVLLGLLYLLAVYRIAVLLFGKTYWMVLTVALNCANPLVLDHFATARGYGMGLAFWVLGFYFVLRCISEPAGAGRWVVAGAAFGLAAASYMTEVFAVAAVIVVLTALYGRRALILGASAFAVAAPILYGPLRLARPAGIDGETSYRMAWKTFLGAFVNYRPSVLAKYRFGWHVLDRWPYGILLGFLGLLLISTVVLAIRWARATSLAKLDETDRRFLVLAPVVLAVFTLLRIEPVILHHVFFAERRLLFTAPLLLLAAPLFAFWMRRQWARAGLVAGRMVAFFLSLLALHFASMFTLDSFWGWDYDAGSKAIAGVLRERKPASPRQPVRVGASWFFDSSLNYYRAVYGMDWIAPVTRASPGCFYDYYAVEESELPGLSRFAPRVLYRSPVARTVLAELGPAVRSRLATLERAGFFERPACFADLTRHEPFAAAGKPGANGHFLRDVMEGPDSDAQRWTFEHPAFLFDVSDRSNPKFRLDLRLPVVTYKDTGPVRLAVWINGRRLGEQLCSAPGDHSFERPVPPPWLGEDGLAIVETTLDKYYVAPEDKQKLGYLFLSGGFVN
jgi:hypothetical protein